MKQSEKEFQQYIKKINSESCLNRIKSRIKLESFQKWIILELLLSEPERDIENKRIINNLKKAKS